MTQSKPTNSVRVQRPSLRESRNAPPPRPKRAVPTWVWITAGVLVLVGIVSFLWSHRTLPAPDGVVTYAVATTSHVDGTVTYEQTPPVGGDHSPRWQNCGYYSSAIASENAVHSMEHGAVWITYQPDLNPDQVNRIRQLAAMQDYVVASPFRDQGSPIVASAWGKQLRVDSTDDPRLEQFIRAFRQGPQTPEPGAPCSGGVGIPR
jgi:hypothetical protein